MHLGQDTHRVHEMLKDLMGVDDTEGGALEGQGYDVPAGQSHLLGQTPFAQRRLSRLQDAGRGTEGHDPPQGDALSKTRGDGCRFAVNVERVHSHTWVGKQVGGRVCRATSRARARHCRAVTVDVVGRSDGVV